MRRDAYAVAPESQRGQTLPFVAMVLVMLMGMAALSVDIGYYRFEQRLQQSAADSAALAGAAELAYGSTYASSAAKSDAATNGFQDGAGGVTVSVNPNYSSPYTGTSGAVEVVISKSYSRFFGALFSSGNATISTRAVARMSANAPYCLYQLSPSGKPNFNGMAFNGPQCGIIMNGTGNFNGAHVDALTVGYAGGTPNLNGATFVEAAPTPALPVQDPCPDIPGCNYLANNPPSSNPCSSFQGNGYHGYLNPGCYSGMNLNGATVTLNPGTYVLSSGSYNFNGAALRGTGVTFYITAGTSLNFNGATLNLTPPTTGNMADVLMYQVPGNSNNPNFNGASSQTVSGLLYFPSASVNFNGSLGAYAVLVVSDVNFNGSTQNFPSPPAGATLVQAPALAE